MITQSFLRDADKENVEADELENNNSPAGKKYKLVKEKRARRK